MATLPDSQPAVPGGPDALEGTTIDRYLVQHQLGAGGMGLVYAAADQTLARQVALKVLRTSVSRDERAVTRLLREARALAKLSHPNVVAVYDAGVSGPHAWVAMELIRGATLRRWAASKRRWPEVVKVLCQAAAGVDAAHQAGLVHRDLKPENVLVGDDGRVVVTDFGLVHAASSEPLPDEGAAAPQTLELDERITRAGALMGTPGYMAPEQLRREPTDARTDQFAFAVTAYEALWHVLPFPGSLAKATPEHPWPRPPQGPPTAPPASAVPAKVWRVLERALSLDPAARFPSMAQLSAALEATLPNRRSATGLAVAATAVAMLVALGVGGLTTSRCAGGQVLLAAVWNESRKEAVRSALLAGKEPMAPEVATAVVSGLDAYAARWADTYEGTCKAQPQVSLGWGQLAHALAANASGAPDQEWITDLRLSCLRRLLAELDALVTLLSRDGGARVAQAQDAVRALSPLATCTDTRTLAGRPPVPPGQQAEVDALERRISELKALEDLGQYVAALEPARALADDARKLGYPPTAARAVTELARVQNLSAVANSEALAEPLFDEAVNLAERAGDDRLRIRALLLRTQLLINKPRLEEAAAGLKACQALRQRLDDPRISREVVGMEAELAAAEGRGEDALRLSKQAVDLIEQAPPVDESELLGAVDVYAFALLRAGRLAEAAEQFKRTIPLAERTLGAKNPGLAKVLSMYAATLGKLHRLDEARPHHARASEVMAAALGPESAAVAYLEADWGMVLAANNDLKGAKEALEHALAIELKTLSPTDPSLASVYNGLGVVAALSGNTHEAPDRFKACLEIRERALGPNHPRVLGDLNDLASAYEFDEKHAEALATFDTVLERLASLPKERSMAPGSVARIRLGRAEALTELHRFAEAKDELDRSRPLAMADEDPTMRGWQLLQQALVAWDGFGQAAAAKADATESRVVAVQLEDTDTQKNIDELLARIKAGKRESGPPQR